MADLKAHPSLKHCSDFLSLSVLSQVRVHTRSSIDIIRIAGIKLVEHWSEQNALGMLQQLGVILPPGQASS